MRLHARHVAWLVALVGTVALAAEPPLPEPVARWDFDAGTAAVAADVTGHGHDAAIAGAQPVPRGAGHALRFRGEPASDALTVSADRALNISSVGTIAFWCRPDAPRGALFGWGEETERGDHTFAVVFDTRTDGGEPGNELRLYAGGRRRYQIYSTELPDLPLGRWTHVAVVVSGTALSFYFDGEPVMEVALPFAMDLTDQPLALGRYKWAGQDGFDGLIDEVAVYPEPLSPQQVRELYSRQCGSFGHDPKLLSQPAVETHVQPEPGRIALRIRTARMGALPAGATVRAAIAGTQVAAEAPADPAGGPMLLSLDVAAVPAGTCEVQCELIGPDGSRLGDPWRQSIQWPGRDPAFAGVRVLNNLVWELLNERPGELGGERELSFTQPRRRWICVRCDGRDVDLSVDGKALPQPEAMLFLPPGRHALMLRPRAGGGRVDSLVVRSIPQIIFDTLVPEPHIRSAVPLDEEFIRRYVAPSVNTFTVGQSKARPQTRLPLFRELLGSGRRFLGGCLVPSKVDGKPITADGAAEFLAGSWGMTHPELNGAIADEFGVSEPHCLAYAQAWRRLHADPRFADRDYVPYVGRLYTGEAGRQFVRALIDTGSAFSFKRYLPCPATEQAARDYIRRSFVAEAQHFRAACPGAVESMIVCFGYFCTPNEFLNVVPQANYKTYLDMQFRTVATEPELWAARGLHNYLVHYADEETTRWIIHLFRHYGIEGSTDPAATDPFDSSPLLANGDFADSTRGWRLEPAAPDSIGTVDEIHFAWLQGRYPYTAGGDTALRMVRNPGRPNVASQTIRHLTPGRLYAARMISAVHGDMSRKDLSPGLRLDIRGAKVIPEQSYTCVFHNSYAHSYGPYNQDHQAWMTYHWVLFQAESDRAELSISDWTDDQHPGGAIGQAAICNFVQVHPYFADGP